MFALHKLLRPHAPQIHEGTTDFFPDPPDPRDPGAPPLPDPEGAPTPLGLGHATYKPGLPGDPVRVEELLVFHPGCCAPPPPGRPSGLRLPPRMRALYRPPTDPPQDRPAFEAEVTRLRDTLAQPMPCFRSVAVRWSQLQPAYPEQVQDVQTLEVFTLDGNHLIGQALVAATGPATTQQHWVFFDPNAPFDRVRVVRKEGGHPTLSGFLTAMDERQQVSGLPALHAVEQVTHHTDIDW